MYATLSNDMNNPQENIALWVALGGVFGDDGHMLKAAIVPNESPNTMKFIMCPVWSIMAMWNIPVLLIFFLFFDNPLVHANTVTDLAVELCEP